MKKYIFTIILGVLLLIFGTFLAALPKLTLKCDGWNCVLYRNFFGQIIQKKYKFTYGDVQRCDVKPINTIGEHGEIQVKGYTLRFGGPNIHYTPEWKNNDSEILSDVCNSFFRRKPIKFSDDGFFNFLKSIWFILILCGGYLILATKKSQE